jgi:hypothetical protein
MPILLHCFRPEARAHFTAIFQSSIKNSFFAARGIAGGKIFLSIGELSEARNARRADA